MNKSLLLPVLLLAVQSLTLSAAPTTRPTTEPDETPTTSPLAQGALPPTTQPAAVSRIVSVTVYQGSALVTRQVQVPAGAGIVELTVGPLPPQTLDSSPYTEAGDGVRVLTTQFRTRAVKQDTREAVRTLEDQIRALQYANAQLQKTLEVDRLNLATLGKLEGFTSATLATLTEKGKLDSESTLKLVTFLMDKRASLSQLDVELGRKVQENAEQMTFLQRRLGEVAAGADRTERQAVIVLDKTNAGPATVRLNYLVSAASWQPRYKLHAAGEKDPVTVEYLAEVAQQSGEDWSHVDLVVSTAQPMLSAAPPDLLALDVDVENSGVNQSGNAQAVINKLQRYSQARALRQEAQKQQYANNNDVAQGQLNTAAASEQFADLLAEDSGEKASVAPEGPSVAYHLSQALTIPSRPDPQFLEIARIELEPTYFYKTEPVLSRHVYRLANLPNKSKYVLLPGEATMYVGTDFVGRMTLPLVAIGEEFTAGFGVDPQLQVERTLVQKSHSVQGGNQVQSYGYRISINNFKQTDVTLQVWDRLPNPQTESVAVELLQTAPALSADPEYERNQKPLNLLRWDVPVKAGAAGASATTVVYNFKLQYARDVTIGDFKTTRK